MRRLMCEASVKSSSGWRTTPLSVCQTTQDLGRNGSTVSICNSRRCARFPSTTITHHADPQRNKYGDLRVDVELQGKSDDARSLSNSAPAVSNSSREYSTSLKGGIGRRCG